MVVEQVTVCQELLAVGEAGVQVCTFVTVGPTKVHNVLTAPDTVVPGVQVCTLTGVAVTLLQVVVT